MIVEKIIEKIRNNEIENKESALSMCIYLLLEENKYNKGFAHIRIIGVDGEYMLYVPKSNFAKEFDNNYISNELIIDYNANGIRKLSDDYDDCNLKKYIKKEEKENLKRFQEIILKSESALDFYKKIDNEISINERFLHDINRYIFQEYNLNNKQYIDLLEDICFLKKENFKKTIYDQSLNSKIYPRDVSYVSFYENYKMTQDLNKYIKPQKELIQYLVDNNEIEKVFLIGQKNKARKYLEKKYNKEITDILLSDISNEEKYLNIINGKFKEFKNSCIKTVMQLNDYGIIEDIELYKDQKIQQVNLEIKNQYLNKEELSIEVLENITEIDLSKKIENMVNLNFLKNLEYYLMFQGIEFGISYFTEESEKKSNYIILKDNNEFVGYLSYSEENNLIKIDSIEIFKSHRGKGFCEKLLEKLAEISESKNKVIYNTRYSDEGIIKLPNKKKKLNEQMNCLFIDLDLRGDNLNKHYLNEDIVKYIRQQNNFDLKKFKDSYLSVIKEDLINNKNNEFFDKIIRDYNSKFKNKIVFKL